MKSAGKLPIVCGGTGLYLRGLLHGVFDGGGADEGIRCELEDRLRSEGLPAMYRELQRVDPDATHIMPNDQQRILRALEVFYSSGRPISQLQTQTQDQPRYRAATFVLERPREELYARINARVDAMVDRGLIAEVREYL
jgi:tRNA dimethylallyltransferase